MAAEPVNVHEAKTHFSKLIQRVLAGEEIVIAKGGTPVAKLVPLTRTPARRTPGSAKGLFTVPKDFDAPMPPEFMRHFE